MRQLMLATLPVLLLPLAGIIQIQAQPGIPAVREEQIKVPSVEVRCGPSASFPVTMTLRKNATVVIRTRTTANTEFLEIAPPPGSISWVPKAIVTKMGTEMNGRQAFSITGEASDSPVPIYPGGPSITEGPLMVDPKYPGKTEARRGTQGFIIGNPVKPAWDDRQFYPILPLPGESRFIPREAVYPEAGAIAGTKPPASGNPTTPPKDTRALFSQAQQADKAGNIQQAIDLYEQVARESSVTNDGLANYCATRVYELRRKANMNGTLTSRTNDARTSRSAPTPPAPPLPGTTNSTNSQSSAKSSNLRSTGAGFLRKAGFTIDNRSAYALMDQSRRVLFYVTSEPGVTLEPYVEHWVDLSGIVEVRGGLGSSEYMRVVRISLLR